MYDYLIVGAGLAGCTMAERLATQLHASVLLVDKREHIGGNCHDPLTSDGLRYHQFGPHIFHTNAPHIVTYLSRFTKWLPYEHRVRANLNGKTVPIPINRTTINTLYDLDLDDAGIAALLARSACPIGRIENSEDMIVSRVGRELYELFFRGYTRKHWGLDPSQLDATVCGRIPTRTNDDDRYFSDQFQAMPIDGFTAMMQRMTADPRIEIVTGIDFRVVADRARFKHIIFTGPIDEYFDFQFGRLPYRSLTFEFETVDREFVQSVGCINEPSESVPFTRTTEYKHITGQQHAKTIISREYPQDSGDPYYPIPRPENRPLYERYRQLAEREANVTFVGRLAEYRYYNMDQVVASALVAYKELANAERLAS